MGKEAMVSLVDYDAFDHVAAICGPHHCNSDYLDIAFSFLIVGIAVIIPDETLYF